MSKFRILLSTEIKSFSSFTKNFADILILECILINQECNFTVSQLPKRLLDLGNIPLHNFIDIAFCLLHFPFKLLHNLRHYHYNPRLPSIMDQLRICPDLRQLILNQRSVELESRVRQVQLYTSAYDFVCGVL